MTEEEINEKRLWKIVERKNFDKNLAAWEEHLLKVDISFNDARDFVHSNKDRILFAYIPDDNTATMQGFIWNEKYADSVRTEKEYLRLLY